MLPGSTWMKSTSKPGEPPKLSSPTIFTATTAPVQPMLARSKAVTLSSAAVPRKTKLMLLRDTKMSARSPLAPTSLMKMSLPAPSITVSSVKPTVTKLPRGSDKKSAGLIGPFSTTLVDTGTGKLPGKVPP
jgi:hypothetical protein